MERALPMSGINLIRELPKFLLVTFVVFSLLVFRRLRFEYNTEDLYDFLMLFLGFLTTRFVYLSIGRKMIVSSEKELAIFLQRLSRVVVTYLLGLAIFLLGGVTYMQFSITQALQSDLVAGALIFPVGYSLIDVYNYVRERYGAILKVSLSAVAMLFLSFAVIRLINAQELSQEAVNLYYALDFVYLGFLVYLSLGGANFLLKRLKRKETNQLELMEFLRWILLYTVGNTLLLFVLLEGYRLITFDIYLHTDFPKFSLAELMMWSITVGTISFLYRHFERNKETPTSSSVHENLKITFNHRTVLLPQSEIVAVVIENKITSVVSDRGKKYPVDLTLEMLMQQLDPELFFRINRSTILHRNSIRLVSSQPNRTLLLELTNDLPAKSVSRYNASRFRKWL